MKDRGNKYDFILQTKFNENGNCLQACLATLLKIDINKIPDFDINNDGEGKWMKSFSNWLDKEFNKIFFLFILNSELIFLLKDSLYILLIDSNSKNKHAVIARKNTIIFDPMVGKIGKRITKKMNPQYLIIVDKF